MLFALCAAVFTSCETYGDPEIEYTAVAPLDGRWVCLMYEYADFKANGENAAPRELVEVWASNTADNVPDKMWHNMVFPMAPAIWEADNSVLLNDDGDRIFSAIDVLSIKIDSDPVGRTFGATNTVGVPPASSMVSPLYYAGTTAVSTRYTVMTGWKATITEAAVIEDGVTMASGTVTDKISYAIEFDHPINGVSKFQVVGNRYTLWAEDYLYIDEFVAGY